jgi:XRE family transcriptional regulator, regulator of sulfur utilization
MEPSEAFGAAMKEVRAERGISQEAAAQASSLDRSYYGALERSVKTPTLPTIWKIAGGLEIKPSELLRRAEQILARQ